MPGCPVAKGEGGLRGKGVFAHRFAGNPRIT